jgi:hypothetical protein
MLSTDGVGHHYALVLGYDDPRDRLILLDPRKGEILVPAAVFDRNWARCQRFTLLACSGDVYRIARSPQSVPPDTGGGVPRDPSSHSSFNTTISRH